MNKKGQVTLLAILTVISIVLTSIILYFFRGSVGDITSNIILEFPKSNSSILSEIGNNTYLMNEEVYAKIIFDNEFKMINFSINDNEQNSSEISNYTFIFPLDTLINNENSRQTKTISIHGNVITENEREITFSKNNNYEIVSNLEEASYKIAKDATTKADKANTLALGAIIGSIILFVIGQIITIYLWKKDKCKIKGDKND